MVSIARLSSAGLVIALATAACTAQSTSSAGSPSGSVAGVTVSGVTTQNVQLLDAKGQPVGTAILAEGTLSMLLPSMTGSPGPSAATNQSPSPNGSATTTAASPASTASTTPAPTAMGVLVTFQITKLPPGTHGVHIDAVGRCDGPDFSSSGPHFNPTHKQHGVKNPNGPHAGDLPNLTVGQDGTITAAFLTNTITLQRNEPNSVFQPDGTALVIDASPDDDVSQPAGNSGAHIACGVIAASGSASAATVSASPMHSATPSMKPSPTMMSPTPSPTK